MRQTSKGKSTTLVDDVEGRSASVQRFRSKCLLTYISDGRMRTFTQVSRCEDSSKDSATKAENGNGPGNVDCGISSAAR